MPFDRRAFIRTVLLGSGMVFSSWREVFASVSGRLTVAGCGFTHGQPKTRGTSLPAPARTLSTDMVVVGGGAAGIAAAWRAHKSGKRVLVLESEKRLGGVMLSPAPQWKGIEYPLGSTYFARRDGVIGEFLGDLGIRPIETGEDAFCFENSAVVDPRNPVNITDLPISAKDRNAFRVFRDFILALPLPTYPVATASTDLLAEYDPITALSFVERFKSPVLTKFMDLYSRSVLGAPLSEVNAYSFLSFYSVEFGDAFKLPCWMLPGGLGAIAGAAERYLGKESILTNAWVVKVENVGTGVEATFVDRVSGEVGVVKAAKAVVATSKQEGRDIVRAIPEAQGKAMAELRYAPYLTVALCCNAPIFNERAFDFWIDDPKGRFTDIIDVTSSQDALSHTTRTGPNVYMVSAPLPYGSLAETDEPTLARRLVSRAQEIASAVGENVPNSREKIEELHVFGWTNSMVVPLVGSYAKLIPLISRPVGNVHLAHSDNDIAPGWENAVVWGIEAARRVMG